MNHHHHPIGENVMLYQNFPEEDGEEDEYDPEEHEVEEEMEEDEEERPHADMSIDWDVRQAPTVDIAYYGKQSSSLRLPFNIIDVREQWHTLEPTFGSHEYIYLWDQDFLYETARIGIEYVPQGYWRVRTFITTRNASKSLSSGNGLGLYTLAKDPAVTRPMTAAMDLEHIDTGQVAKEFIELGVAALQFPGAASSPNAFRYTENGVSRIRVGPFSNGEFTGNPDIEVPLRLR